MYLCPIWGKTDVKWSNANWTWSECRIVGEILEAIHTGVDASKLIEPHLPWIQDKEKKKVLVKLICKIKNEKYEEEKEKIENIKITVKDIKLAVKTVSGIEIDIKE
jgi:hypothetical protein